MAPKMKKLPKNFVLKSKELERILGSRVAIKRKVEAGELQALGSGIYSSPALDPMIAAALEIGRAHV